MRLIQNKASDNHQAAVAYVFEGAEQISIAVAFLKDGGARIIGQLLEARLKQGSKIEAFLGTDFYITEPKALAYLLAIKKRFGAFEMFLANGKTSTFHPKSYVGRSNGQVRCLIGSANLTIGALTTNDEISILATVSPEEQLSLDLTATFTGFRESGNFQELDDLVLGQYASRHKDAEQLRRKIEKEQEKNSAAQFDLRRLEGFVRHYKADETESSALAKRRADRYKALKVQQAIADLGSAESISKKISLTSKRTSKILFLLKDLINISGTPGIFIAEGRRLSIIPRRRSHCSLRVGRQPNSCQNWVTNGCVSSRSIFLV